MQHFQHLMRYFNKPVNGFHFKAKCDLNCELLLLFKKGNKTFTNKIYKWQLEPNLTKI